MVEFSFPALGTVWWIMVDHLGFDETDKRKVINFVADFEARYSRFLSDSEIGKINRSKKEKVGVSADLKKMLELGKTLQTVTEGRFNLNINRLLLSYGYDKEYSFAKRAIIHATEGSFSLSGDTLIKKGEVELDLGGVGKGYLIDRVSKLLTGLGYKFHLVDGGGDIYATTKADGHPWKIALEHPTNRDEAFGVVEIKNESVATSSSNKRRAGKFHHLLNPETKRPEESILSVTTLAKKAFLADAGATAIFVSDKKNWQRIAQMLGLNYLVVFPDLSYEASANFGLDTVL